MQRIEQNSYKYSQMTLSSEIRQLYNTNKNVLKAYARCVDVDSGLSCLTESNRSTGDIMYINDLDPSFTLDLIV